MGPTIKLRNTIIPNARAGGYVIQFSLNVGLTVSRTAHAMWLPSGNGIQMGTVHC